MREVGYDGKGTKKRRRGSGWIRGVCGRQMSGVEEGGGEPSSGSTPDKKSPDGFFTVRSPLGSVAPPGPIDRRLQLLRCYSRPLQKKCKGICSSRHRQVSPYTLTGEKGFISGNRASAASRAPRWPGSRGTRAGKR